MYTEPMRDRLARVYSRDTTDGPSSFLNQKVIFNFSASLPSSLPPSDTRDEIIVFQRMLYVP